ncbi:hypothetical protein Ga0100231_006245 [Opitutaceae bacterium TAV4]|nr:hypothetical protein Ga0100231_006245 [Opitutaceae bacterium TAV4]RRK02605.1 hypothetical protein Ga0100230_005680 [Opitutaceae bacterium TAV3]
MSFPGKYARFHRSASPTPGAAAASDDVPLTLRLPVPVVLVTEARGREVFRSSARLFSRLEVLAKSNVSILQLRVDEHVLHPRSVAALETMLRVSGWRNFERAARSNGGIGRARRTRWAWEFLDEYLGWKWERSA